MDWPRWFRLSNPDLQHELQQAGRGSVGSTHRLRSVLVISEMALAVMLLVGAGLMLKSLHRVLGTDPGFDPHNLLTGVVSLPGNKYSDGPRQLAFQHQLLSRIRSLPGVQDAAAVTTVPMSGSGNTSRFDLEGHPKSSGGQEYEADTPTVSQNYFSVMGIPLRAGRFFNSQDHDKSTHVVIVNQAMADMVFPNQDPIGKRINFTYTNEPNYVQIAGVVGNENVDSLDAPPTPIVYDCYEQDPYPYFSLVIRTRKDPGSLVGAVTRAIHDLEPQAPVFKVSSMSQIISTSPAMLVPGLSRIPHRRIFRAGAPACHPGALWGPGIQRGRALARTWLAHGVGRAARRCAEDGGGERPETGSCRSCSRRSGRFDHGAADRKSAVRRCSHGCANFRGRVRRALRGRDDGQLHSGPSRDQGRSHGGPAV